MGLITLPNLLLCVTLISSLNVVAANVDEFAIKCPLVWEKTTFGESLPKSSVASSLFSQSNYIARVEKDSIFIGGRWKDGKVFIYYNNVVEVVTSDYEILTNPFDCFVDWQPKSYSGSNKVVFDVSIRNGYVGRAVSDNVMISGEIISSILNLVDNNENHLPMNSFQVLRSFSKGLSLKMIDFEFSGDNFTPAKDFAGMDEIYNNGESEITQIVTFKNRILQSTTLTSKSSQMHTIRCSASAYVDAKFDAEGIQLGAGYQLDLSAEFTWGTNKTKEIKTEIETTVEVTREVIVPPFTSVQVCSTVNLIDDFNLEYTATGIYTAPGLSQQEIIQILALDNKIGIIKGKDVVVPEQGTFKGALTMNNQFIVVPLENPEGCSKLQELIRSTKLKRKHGILSNKEILEDFLQIDSFIKQMTKPSY